MTKSPEHSGLFGLITLLKFASQLYTTMMENLLFKKLQIKPGFKVAVWNAPPQVASIFNHIPANISLSYQMQDHCNAYLVFSISKAEMLSTLKAIIGNINEQSIVWILYPKAKSTLAADLNLMQSWDDLKLFGLAPCASAAINDIWTAIRVKPISHQKKSGVGNAEITKNEYGDYIDVVNKIVKLPKYLKDVLAKQPEALDFYQKLAYSHQKEYVLWILTAKQEKTRLDRIAKMITKLLEKKKNPTEK